MTITVKDASGANVALETPNANGQATMVNSKPVVIASNQWAAHDAPATGAPVSIGAIYNNNPVASAVGTSGDAVRLTAMYYGALGTALFGNSAAPGDGAVTALTYLPNEGNTGAYQALATLSFVWNGATTAVQRGDTNGTYVVPKPVTAGGLLIKRLIAATNGVIKASAGQLYGGTFTNSNAAIRYLQIYNKATAGTLSTDTPVLTIPLPPNVSVVVDFASLGAEFTTGISWQFTTDDIAIPTTAGASTDIHGAATYK